MKLTHLDELERFEMRDGFVWRPVRKHFGIQAFGANAYTPGATGRVVEEHTEGVLGHEEIYLVLRGRVRFTVDGNDHELGPGQLVFLRDPSLKRGAIALTDDAAVLAIGGKPGATRDLGLGVHIRGRSRSSRGRFDEARRLLHEGLEAKPGRPADSLRPRVRRGARRRHDKALSF